MKSIDPPVTTANADISSLSASSDLSSVEPSSEVTISVPSSEHPSSEMSSIVISSDSTPSELASSDTQSEASASSDSATSSMDSEVNIDAAPQDTNEITGEMSKLTFWTSGGKSYHFSQSCTTLARSKNINQGTLQQALNKGKSDPCDRCANG